MYNDENAKVIHQEIGKEMQSSFMAYAMSVIVSRALPDVRDGLKPVQRRVLYSMIELNNTPDKPHRKCARIVGDTMGKYHPHGDSSIYGEHDPLYEGRLDELQSLMRSKCSGVLHWQVMAGAGHWAQHENPAAFCAALQRALP